MKNAKCKMQNETCRDAPCTSPASGGIQGCTRQGSSSPAIGGTAPIILMITDTDNGHACAPERFSAQARTRYF